MDTERTFKIAQSLTPGITAEIVRTLHECGVSPEDFMLLPMQQLSDRMGVSPKFQDLHRQEALFKARKEEAFIDKHSIRTLYLMDEDYPILLRETQDAPVVLYVLGDADLNACPIMNIVGTRKCTMYGINFCHHIVGELAGMFPNMTIVSGLAHGIDSAGHEAALNNNLRTIAVVAHGLDTIYPAANRDLARRILKAGGAIVTEYPSGTRAFRNNFLQRNRIVAGLSELTFVVESEVRGGAMSTANMAFSYSREVMALPGRWNDKTSAGCNYLIEHNKASIFFSVADLMRLMQWNPLKHYNILAQKPMFPELEGEQAEIYRFLSNKNAPAQIDEIHQATGLSMPSLMSSLTELEFDGVISKLPGARYECC